MLNQIADVMSFFRYLIASIMFATPEFSTVVTFAFSACIVASCLKVVSYKHNGS